MLTNLKKAVNNFIKPKYPWNKILFFLLKKCFLNISYNNQFRLYVENTKIKIKT